LFAVSKSIAANVFTSPPNIYGYVYSSVRPLCQTAPDQQWFCKTFSLYLAMLITDAATALLALALSGPVFKIMRGKVE
jgi:hypothetical protein